MEIYQCLTIGINRYQYLRPLNYGIADAQALYQVLCQQIKVPPQSLCVLSDPTYPGRRKILDALDSLSPASHLWFFFSGYAMEQGGEDYLLPIDANPATPEKTGLKIAALFDKLQQTNAERILVILDLHRVSHNAPPPGTTAIAVAKNLGLTLILSAAREPHAPGISHPNGLLTTALTEALRHYQHQLTLNLLEQYFQTRLPELNHIQGLNQQTPVIVAPSWKMRSQPLFFEPVAPVMATTEKEARANGEDRTATLTLPKLPVPPVEAAPPPSPPANPIAVERAAPEKKPPSKPGGPLFWAPWLLVGAALLWWGWAKGGEKYARVDRPSPAAPLLAGEQASSFHRAILRAALVEPGGPDHEAARADITRWSRVIFDIAAGRAEKGDYRGAIAAARLIPEGEAALYVAARESMTTWTAALERQKVDRVLLEAARKLIEPGQPRSYLEAITVLGRIEPGSREYESARRSIEGWSEDIYNLAREQAREKNFSRAVRIARSVPPSTGAYFKAEKSIRRWSRGVGENRKP